MGRIHLMRHLTCQQFEILRAGEGIQLRVSHRLRSITVCALAFSCKSSVDTDPNRTSLIGGEARLTSLLGALRSTLAESSALMSQSASF